MTAQSIPAMDDILVLLVDDDVVDRKNIIRMLTAKKDHHYIVTVAKNFEEAINALNSYSFDLCLFDYYLGGFTGLELLDKIHSINLNASIIMLTGSDNEEIDHLSLEAGASGFLNKNTLTATLLERSIRYAMHHKKLSIEHEQLAYYDSLTKLANRSLFFDRLDFLVSSSSCHDCEHTLLYFDLDNFQQINFAHGRLIGDKLLQAFARLLLQSVDENNTIARLGGDEFVLILENDISEKAYDIARHIIEEMAQPFLLENEDVSVNMTTSIGMVFFSTGDDGKDSNLIFEKADQALLHAKKMGRNRYCHFDDELAPSVKEHNVYEDNIRLGFQEDTFFPHYQPIYCLATHKVEGFEALARWQHPEGSLIYPQQFLSVIDKLNFMPELTDTIITKACPDLVYWSTLISDSDLRVAVNVSDSEKVHYYLLEMVKSAIKKSNIKPHQLDLEFDGSVLFSQSSPFVNMLHQFNDLGVNITVNNVGKGDLSLWSLADLPISTLKIDMSLIQGIGVNLSKEIIVKVLLDMAKQFSLKTTAMGVETEEQAEFLLRYGCDYVQGYLYSRPLSFEDCSKLLISS